MASAPGPSRLPPPTAPPLPRPALMLQEWRDVAFWHWPLPPEEAAPLLPPGTRPDVLDGVTYVGVVAFRVARTRLPGGVPGGGYGEVNVRLYSVDGLGRRGVVFLSLEASSAHTVLAGRAAAGLPYMWSDVSVSADGDGVAYATRRRLPRSPGPARGRFRLRVGDPVDDPSPFERFVTDRWGLHTHHAGRTRWVAAAHPDWRLYRASPLGWDETLLERAGIARPPGVPSVLFSPGTDTRFAPGGALPRHR
ncbi:YqjF family protein [Nocardiopsis tropica]|uniref:DUF2071 domain-containing protein n=1 Tax=Nocardiopsis tropica TaxID=109330 RepID=A0ABV1ZR60_9ACTN